MAFFITQKKGVPMSQMIEKQKIFYRRYIQELFNEGQLDRAQDYVAQNYVLHNAPPSFPTGVEAIRHVVSLFRSAFPDLKITIDDLISEGNLVAARSTMRGTHRGEFFGILATQKQVVVPSLTLVRIVEGRVAESWVQNDMMGLVNQLKSG